MKKDFTLKSYQKLLFSAKSAGYSFHRFQDFFLSSKYNTVTLRHDVDRKPENSLIIAKIEKEAGIKASYYFRIVKASYDENIIKQFPI